MTDITKKVNGIVPLNERSQVFTQADGGTGDVLMVQDSLGRAARRVLIEAAAGGAMTVRFNVYQKLYGEYSYTDNPWSQWNGEWKNLTDETTIKDNEGITHSIAAGESMELDNDIPVKDIEILSAAGSFIITVF
jgi:hypothetical protein